jgi:hypothetical protein
MKLENNDPQHLDITALGYEQEDLNHGDYTLIFQYYCTIKNTPNIKDWVYLEHLHAEGIYFYCEHCCKRFHVMPTKYQLAFLSLCLV